jgi:hydrogenase maturation protease
MLEALTLCQALDRVPETVILGVEPQDIETLQVEMTPLIQSKVDEMVNCVLSELDQLGGKYRIKEGGHVPGDPIENR